MNRNLPFISGVTSDVTSREKNLLVTANTLGKIFSGKLESSLSFDSKTKAGLFRFDSTSSGGPSEVTSGYLLVYTPNPDYDTTGTYKVRQLVYDDSSCAVFTRVGVAASISSTIAWSGWVGIAGIDDYVFDVLSNDTYGTANTYYRSYNSFVLTIPDVDRCIQGARIALEQGESMGIVINSNKNYHASDYMYDNVSNLLFQQLQETKDGLTIYRWTLIAEDQTALYNQYKNDLTRRPGGSVWPDVTIEYIEPETIVDNVYPTRFVAYVSKDKNDAKCWLVETVDDVTSAVKQLVSNITEATEHLEEHIRKNYQSTKAYVDAQDAVLKQYIDDSVKPITNMKEYIDAGDANAVAHADEGDIVLRQQIVETGREANAYTDIKADAERQYAENAISTLDTKVDEGDTFLKNYTEKLFANTFKGATVSNVDFNSLESSGVIRFDDTAKNGPTGITSGYALVFNVNVTDTTTLTTNNRQMVYADNNSAVYTREGHLNSNWKREWTDWTPYGDPGSFSSHVKLRMSDTAVANTYYISTESNVLTLPDPTSYVVGTKIALEQVDFTGVVIDSDRSNTTIGRKMFDPVSNILFQYVQPGCWTSVEDVTSATRQYEYLRDYPIKNDKIEYVSPAVIYDVKLPRRFTAIVSLDASGNKYWEVQGIEDASQAITSIMNFVVDAGDTVKKYSDDNLSKSKAYTDEEIAEVSATATQAAAVVLQAANDQIIQVKSDLNQKIDDLTVSKIGENGYFLTSVSQDAGKISAEYTIIKSDMIQRENEKGGVFGATVEDALVGLKNDINAEAVQRSKDDMTLSDLAWNYYSLNRAGIDEAVVELNKSIAKEAIQRSDDDMKLSDLSLYYYSDTLKRLEDLQISLSAHMDFVSTEDAGELLIAASTGNSEASGFTIGRNDLVSFGSTDKVAVESAVKAYVESVAPVTPEATGKMDKVQTFSEGDIVTLFLDSTTNTGNAQSSRYRIGVPVTGSSFGTAYRVATEMGTLNYVAGAIANKMDKVATGNANKILLTDTTGQAIVSDKFLGEVTMSEKAGSIVTVYIPDSYSSYAFLSGDYTVYNASAVGWDRKWIRWYNDTLYLLYRTYHSDLGNIWIIAETNTEFSYYTNKLFLVDATTKKGTVTDPVTTDLALWHYDPTGTGTISTNLAVCSNSTSILTNNVNMYYSEHGKNVATEYAVADHARKDNRLFYDSQNITTGAVIRAVFGTLYRVETKDIQPNFQFPEIVGKTCYEAEWLLGMRFFVYVASGCWMNYRRNSGTGESWQVSANTLYEFVFKEYYASEHKLVTSAEWMLIPHSSSIRSITDPI